MLIKCAEELVTLFSALMANWDLYSSKIDEYFVLLEGSDTVAISDVRLFLRICDPRLGISFYS
jgi:hypothetical protein